MLFESMGRRFASTETLKVRSVKRDCNDHAMDGFSSLLTEVKWPDWTAMASYLPSRIPPFTAGTESLGDNHKALRTFSRYPELATCDVRNLFAILSLLHSPSASHAMSVPRPLQECWSPAEQCGLCRSEVTDCRFACWWCCSTERKSRRLPRKYTV